MLPCAVSRHEAALMASGIGLEVADGPQAAWALPPGRRRRQLLGMPHGPPLFQTELKLQPAWPQSCAAESSVHGGLLAHRQAAHAAPHAPPSFAAAPWHPTALQPTHPKAASAASCPIHGTRKPAHSEGFLSSHRWCWIRTGPASTCTRPRAG